jgi:DNA-binding GntR family transcriptional regulator
LRTAIIRGQFTQGEKLSEPQLATQLGVSRAPIREALIELDREGLVVFDERGKTRVRTLAPQDFRDLLLLRIAIEPVATRLAAEAWTKEDTTLAEENLRLAEETSNLIEFSLLDIAFHDIVMQAARRPMIYGAWRGIRSLLEMELVLLHRDRKGPATDVRTGTFRSHRSLLKLLIAHRADEAERSQIDSLRSWEKCLPDF